MNHELKPAKNALQLFCEFNNKGVRYCHWKSNEHLLQGLCGKTDLDVLIDPADAGIAYQLMVQYNYKQVLSHPWKCYSGVDDWIGLDEEQMLQTHLHIHYRLLTGLKNVKDQYFNFNEIVLNNVLIHDAYEVKVCDPNLEVVLLIIRAALKRSAFSYSTGLFGKDAEKEFEYLRERTDKEKVSRFARQLFSNTVAQEIEKFYQDRSIPAAFKTFQRDLLKEMRFLQRTSRMHAEFTYIWRYLVYTAGKLLRSPVRLKKKSATGGKLISFIGVDGAGKTTLATFCSEWLSWKIDCSYVYLGTGEGKSSLLNRIVKRIISAKNADGTKKQQSETDAEKADCTLSLKREIKRTISNIVRLSNARFKYRTIKKIYRRVNSGEIIITDRYPQLDYTGIYDGMMIKKLTGEDLLAKYNEYLADKEAALFKKMCRFNPNVIIKLVIPVEVSCQRKACGEEELDIIKRKVEITNSLHYPGSKEYTIDSSRDLDTTKKEVVSLLWRYI